MRVSSTGATPSHLEQGGSSPACSAVVAARDVHRVGNSLPVAPWPSVCRCVCLQMLAPAEHARRALPARAEESPCLSATSGGVRRAGAPSDAGRRASGPARAFWDGLSFLLVLLHARLRRRRRLSYRMDRFSGGRPGAPCGDAPCVRRRLEGPDNQLGTRPTGMCCRN